MSHVAKIELEITDLDSLKVACKSLGLEFVCNQKTYAWYGRHVGDYPLPEGMTIEDMGRCDHVIRVPGATYEVGVVRRGNKFALLWDFYRGGGLERVLGRAAGRLKKAYAVERVRREAQIKGYHVQERKTVQGVQLILTSGR